MDWFENYQVQMWDKQDDGCMQRNPCGQVLIRGGEDMSSATIATVIKMMETLPETTQNRVVEHLQGYIADLQDELEWDITFKRTQPQLVAAAQRARQEIAEGLAQPMDYNQL